MLRRDFVKSTVAATALPGTSLIPSKAKEKPLRVVPLTKVYDQMYEGHLDNLSEHFPKAIQFIRGYLRPRIKLSGFCANNKYRSYTPQDWRRLHQAIHGVELLDECPYDYWCEPSMVLLLRWGTQTERAADDMPDNVMLQDSYKYWSNTTAINLWLSPDENEKGILRELFCCWQRGTVSDWDSRLTYKRCDFDPAMWDHHMYSLLQSAMVHFYSWELLQKEIQDVEA